jgi:hypothetical protein
LDPWLSRFGITVKKAVENVVETDFSFFFCLHGGDVQRP